MISYICVLAMDFITIDFETATSVSNTPCEIGLTFVRNGIIQGTYAKLIRPPQNKYEYWNTKVHGIHPRDTAFQPSFDEIWPELKPLIDNQFLIAHNAPFDMGVLRNTLSFYKQELPSVMYACSIQVSKKVWQGLKKYNLKSLCDTHGIHLNHHRAEADSLATAQLCLKAFETAGIESINDIRTKLSTHVWQMQTHGNVRLGVRQKKAKAETDSIFVSKLNPASLFYQKRVVITGNLTTMKRSDALQEILDVGGIPQDDVTPETDFLIVGTHDLTKKYGRYVSRKQRNALEYITQGYSIRFISEPEFIHQLEGAFSF